MTIFNVIQQSNVDGQILVNVTPCADLKSAQAVMAEEINTLLSEETSKYYGLDLDMIEGKDEDDWDCGFNLERTDDHFYLTCNIDDYYEFIDIEAKHLVTIS